MIKNGQYFSSVISAFEQEVLYNYNDRVREIELFFDLISKFEDTDELQFIVPDKAINLIKLEDLQILEGIDLQEHLFTLLRKLKIEKPSFDLNNIFKSNSILLLYNLLESTLSKVDNFLIKTINQTTMKYHEASEKIKVLWFDYATKHQKDKYLAHSISIMEMRQEIFIEIDKQTNDNEKEFQGNLDPLTIDELLGKYGVEVTKNKMMQQETERKAVRNTLVQGRNDLAHGKYSFVEFGKKLKYSSQARQDRENDVLFVKDACYRLLEVILENVEEFVLQEKYKIIV